MPLLTELGRRFGVHFYKHATPTELVSRGPDSPHHKATSMRHQSHRKMKVEGSRKNGQPAYPWGSPQADLAEARRIIYKHGYLRHNEELEAAEQARVGRRPNSETKSAPHSTRNSAVQEFLHKCLNRRSLPDPHGDHTRAPPGHERGAAGKIPSALLLSSLGTSHPKATSMRHQSHHKAC